jgi:hypothetical protein
MTQEKILNEFIDKEAKTSDKQAFLLKMSMKVKY